MYSPVNMWYNEENYIPTTANDYYSTKLVHCPSNKCEENRLWINRHGASIMHGQRNLHIDMIGGHDKSSWHWIDPGIQFWAPNQVHDPQLCLIVAHVQLLRKHAVHCSNKLDQFTTKFPYGPQNIGYKPTCAIWNRNISGGLEPWQCYICSKLTGLANKMNVGSQIAQPKNNVNYYIP